VLTVSTRVLHVCYHGFPIVLLSSVYYVSRLHNGFYEVFLLLYSFYYTIYTVGFTDFSLSRDSLAATNETRVALLLSSKKGFMSLPCFPSGVGLFYLTTLEWLFTSNTDGFTVFLPI